MKLILATHNQGKVREMAQYLAELGLEVLSLADVGAPQVDEVGTTLWENAKLKAVTAASQTGHWALGEDTGLEVDALRGAPGVYSARYAGRHATDQENNAKLLKELQGVPQEQRTARFKTVMVLASPAGNVWTTEGVLEGEILTAPRGSGGFGYDPLFWVPSENRTLAEMDTAEKNAISHRGKALRAMIGLLRTLVESGELDTGSRQRHASP